MRGKRYNDERASQSRDYSGLRYGSITPTDVDALIEYHNKGYIVIELKVNGSTFGGGQKIALERMCNDWQKIGKKSILIVASHDTQPDEVINLAVCTVEHYYYKGLWYPEKKQTSYIGDSVKVLCDAFIKSFEVTE